MAQQRVLVVEDDKNIARLVTYNLEKAGYDCDVTITGEDALVFLDSQPADLIILDIMLPRMDGLAVCKDIINSAIKQDTYSKRN